MGVSKSYKNHENGSEKKEKIRIIIHESGTTKDPYGIIWYYMMLILSHIIAARDSRVNFHVDTRYR